MSNPKRGKRIALLAGWVVVVVVGVAGWVCRNRIKAWYHFYQQFESLGSNEQGYREYRHRQTGIVMVKLPGGRFRMGSPEIEEGRFPYEGPVHEVTLSPFLIAKYEITKAEWSKVMGYNLQYYKGDNFPIEEVSWEECKQFCKETGLVLPTEAQWEYACRAGKNGPYAGTGILDELGWYKANSSGQAHPVGEKNPNDFGLHDMHGNVFEWCADGWDEEFYSKPEASMQNPVCATASEVRVVRGGCWYGSAVSCRSASRGTCLPGSKGAYVGVRPSWSTFP